jgi:ubiquitin-conjugating enzyme E2 Q
MNSSNNNIEQQQQQQPHRNYLPASAAPASRCVSSTATAAAVMVDHSKNSKSHDSSASVEDDAVIAAPQATTTTGGVHASEQPAEIPFNDKESDDDVADAHAHEAGHEDEDESEYEYEDDDDAAFSGFLLPDQAAPAAAAIAAVAVEDPEVAASNSNSSTNDRLDPSAAIVEEDVAASASSNNKWREPSRAAVNMSLRAQQETTGSKRRLAQDLYRIMNQDTEVAGFSLAPQSEDCMDHWTIKLFQFDNDSNLAKDMQVLGINHIQLEMKFPNQYPFEPPFVRVVQPRFKRQTGFVMNGALCMELLTKDGWNPINDIESVIVSIRSLLVVGDGRLQAAVDLPEPKYQALFQANAKPCASDSASTDPTTSTSSKNGQAGQQPSTKRQKLDKKQQPPNKLLLQGVKPVSKEQVGTYTASEAQAAYSHLSDYHKKKGWDTSGWWARKG